MINPADIIHRIACITEVVTDHPLVYFPLIGAWLITELYFIVNAEESHGHTYVMSTGITLIFTAYIISPFAIKTITWHLSELRTLLVLSLFCYGLFLALFGILNKFPPLLAEIFGDPGHSLVPGMMGILYIESNIPFDRITLIIIASPIILLSIIKTIRRIKHRLLKRKQKKQDDKQTSI